MKNNLRIMYILIALVIIVLAFYNVYREDGNGFFGKEVITQQSCLVVDKSKANELHTSKHSSYVTVNNIFMCKNVDGILYSKHVTDETYFSSELNSTIYFTERDIVYDTSNWSIVLYFLSLLIVAVVYFLIIVFIIGTICQHIYDVFTED